MVVAGRYELGERIGRGGQGDVHVAVDRTTGRRVAVKLLKSSSRSLAGRFAREARVMRQLTHPNTVRVLDFGEIEDGKLFMVLELLQGESLSSALQRGPLGSELAIHVVYGVLGSLAEAHRYGIVHRDVKPANVFLCTDPSGRLPVVKLLDFGIAKDPHSAGATVELAAIRAALSGGVLPTVAGAGLTQQDMIIGTPRYMAPEQIEGGAVGPATDVYTAGLLFAELLAGGPLFSGMGELTLLLSRNTSVPLPASIQRSPYGAAIHRATQVDPALRFPDAGSMLEALSAAHRPTATAVSAPHRPVAPAVPVPHGPFALAVPAPRRPIAPAILVFAALGMLLFLGRLAACSVGRTDSSKVDAKTESSEGEKQPRRSPRAKPNDPETAPLKPPPAPLVPPSPEPTREVLMKGAYWYSTAPEVDRTGLRARLRKAGFKRLEFDTDPDTVKTITGDTFCAAQRLEAFLSKEACSAMGAGASKSSKNQLNLVVCGPGVAHVLFCVDETPALREQMRKFVIAYGLNPDVDRPE
ncbi:MAG: serine/threonine protein kinase [Myxococcales bacterium]|nr:serine/threonine protein kinase [Myxococcales bacterium]